MATSHGSGNCQNYLHSLPVSGRQFVPSNESLRFDDAMTTSPVSCQGSSISSIASVRQTAALHQSEARLVGLDPGARSRSPPQRPSAQLTAESYSSRRPAHLDHSGLDETAHQASSEPGSLSRVWFTFRDGYTAAVLLETRPNGRCLLRIERDGSEVETDADDVERYRYSSPVWYTVFDGSVGFFEIAGPLLPHKAPSGEDLSLVVDEMDSDEACRICLA
ncbi:unnamed protein product [Protopolystoma xenopodis]|uniref:Uncharacterized protein n=1 Tax=Protopolystoma xenopodis TaxID=117903 RepID=A0A448WIX3_9PLAT|nr:unnamed protein product [Protopolystoma xenopodis]